MSDQTLDQSRYGRALATAPGGVHLDSREAASAPVVLALLLADGLVQLDGQMLTIPAQGRPFLRNAASFFDQYLARAKPAGPAYSSSV
jgi:coproporphyrinogen III oxidase-like Fe-S oxidoreductase